jgi:thiosulfate/3-mercaptopyruvate sulfurtransferase
MVYTTLVETDTLEEHLHDPNWVIFDCRFDLQEPEWGWEEYQTFHIPRAIYADLNRDQSSPVTPQTGRHPLPDMDTFRTFLSKSGVDEGKQVVVYDAVGGAYASRMWWMLRYYGHITVAVLNGGFTKWLVEKRPTRSQHESNLLSQFKGQPNPQMVVTTLEMENLYTTSDYLLIDARTPERFHAITEIIDTVAGHIPGAVDRFHGVNLNPDNTVKSPQALRLEFQQILGDYKPSQVVVYCGSGVTSCHHLLAMEIAGLSGARLYAGSWSEWIRDPAHPIAKE